MEKENQQPPGALFTSPAFKEQVNRAKFHYQLNDHQATTLVMFDLLVNQLFIISQVIHQAQNINEN
jgi:hypothetical protein